MKKKDRKIVSDGFMRTDLVGFPKAYMGTPSGSYNSYEAILTSLFFFD